MSLPNGPIPGFPEHELIEIEVPEESLFWRSGGWTLDGGKENEQAIKEWFKQAQSDYLAAGNSKDDWTSIKTRYDATGWCLYGSFKTKIPLSIF